MKNIMLDLETMGKTADAAIIAIAAVEFNVKTKELGESFYTVVDLNSSIQSGGIMDADTVIWWMKQSEEARIEFTHSSNRQHIANALDYFKSWLHDRCPVEDLKLWGNGADFDNVILSSAYRRMELQQPWLFWNNRCYRTVKSLYPTIKMQRTGTQHNALEDAKSQAQHLIQLLS